MLLAMSSAGPPRSTDADKHSGQRILCVAFDVMLAETRKLLLQHAGYDVVLVMGSSAARQVAASRHFDAVLVGHDAPYRERVDLLTWIKANMAGVPIIALQSSASETLSLADYAANVYDTDEWLNTLRKALE